MNKNKNAKVDSVLEFLHEDAKKDYMRMSKGIVKSIFRPIQPSDFKDVYLPITKKQGHDLYQLIVQNNCKNIVEFGTSFGISTIYLANAARRNKGKVITTELLKNKASIAKSNLLKADLIDYVDIKVGDAMDTLKDLSEPIDFLFLDGWKDLYLPLFQMLEKHFHAKTIIYADNMDMQGTQYYGNYVLGKKQHYISKMLDGGKAMLTSCAA